MTKCLQSTPLDCLLSMFLLCFLLWMVLLLSLCKFLQVCMDSIQINKLHLLSQFPNLSGLADWWGEAGERGWFHSRSQQACIAPFAQVACMCTFRSHKWSMHVRAYSLLMFGHACTQLPFLQKSHSPEIGGPCVKQHDIEFINICNDFWVSS